MKQEPIRPNPADPDSTPLNARGLHDQQPEWIRLPRPGQLCPRTGLSRSTMNALILPTIENAGHPSVRSVSLRRKDAHHGVRLIHYPDLLRFIASAGSKVVSNEEVLS